MSNVSSRSISLIDIQFDGTEKSVSLIHNFLEKKQEETDDPLKALVSNRRVLSMIEVIH